MNSKSKEVFWRNTQTGEMMIRSEENNGWTVEGVTTMDKFIVYNETTKEVIGTFSDREEAHLCCSYAERQYPGNRYIITAEAPFWTDRIKVQSKMTL